MTLNLNKVYEISKDKDFVNEFLFLSETAFIEAKAIYEEALVNKDLDKYRAISHKLKTNLLLLGLVELIELIEIGKQKLKNLEMDDEFATKLFANIDLVIQKVKNQRS